MRLKIIRAVWGGACLAILAPVALAAASAAEQERAAAIVAERCSICHGKGGESASPIYPRLAGQHAEYVARQLADFKSGKRKSETMQPQAAPLTPEEMVALGAYFEQRKAGGRPARDGELVAVGKYIFDQGNRFSGLPACASCHGPKGLGTAQLPRLAGQHPRYVEDQLRQFNKRERTNDNAIMHTVASKLSELEAHAVAEYVATLD
jgi:cytochrome c553